MPFGIAQVWYTPDHAVAAYAGLTTLCWAMQRAASTESSAIASALGQLSAASPLPTVFGPVGFDENRQGGPPPAAANPWL